MVENSKTFDRICTKRCHMDKAKSFIKSLNIAENRYIIVGCSGGPDSMCLLDILFKMNCRIVCAHVDHNIREESKDEYIFVKNYCEKRNILFEGLELPPDLNENEAYYRKRRYEFYKELAHKYDTPYIMTAHHGDDLIETVLMRITRGSRLGGYLGFKKDYEEDDCRFIKPLIFYTKRDILEYVQKNEIPYVIDATNDRDIYTRNRYRHNVLPFLKSESPDVHLKYLQFSEELARTDEYIDSLVQKNLADNFSSRGIDLKKFISLDSFLQRRELEAIFKDVYKNDVDKLGVFHIENILTNIRSGKNFSLDLPLGIRIKREYDTIKISEDKKSDAYRIELTSKTILPNGDTIEILDFSEDTSNYTTRLNTKDLATPLYIRTRKDGDAMCVKNMNGSKKIKSIFIDAKVEPSKRDEHPILVDANETVLWLPGIKKSKFDINKEGKYDIILKYTQRKENIDEKK